MKIIKGLYLFFLTVSLFTFLWLYDSIQSVGTDSFDVSRWLDADIFIINHVFLPSFVIGIILLVAEQFILKKAAR